MHIALGVRTDQFPIDGFLGAVGRRTVSINALSKAGEGGATTLTFASNPNRRGGEWLIRDQFSHRHASWTRAAGFPDAYDADNPPYVLVFKVGDHYHARWTEFHQLKRLGATVIPPEISQTPKGITDVGPALLTAFAVPPQTMLERFVKQEATEDAEPFNPSDAADGRQRILAAVVRRLGQRNFRRRLIKAYDGKCAMTRCAVAWVLEAAHISPYRGLKTNALSNGLLLRADLHTLFDLALVSVDPADLTIRVSGRITDNRYRFLEGKVLATPGQENSQPSRLALAEHFRVFDR